MLRVWISEVHFNDGSKISIDKNDIVVLVGPNNAGKSVTLREMATILNARTNLGKVVKDIAIERNGDENELISFLETSAEENYVVGNSEPFFRGIGFNIDKRNAMAQWRNYKNGLSQLSTVFANALTTEARLTFLILVLIG